MFAEINAINNIAFLLERFKWVQPSKVANCRCPICGDSKDNPRKARGYFVQFKDTFFYKCHKCGASMSLGAFLKDKFPLVYQEYRLEKFKNDNGVIDSPVVEKEISLEPIKPTSRAISIVDLDNDHPAKKYIAKRMIPVDRWDDIGYVKNFSEFVMETSGLTKYKRLPKDERIVLELRDTSGKLFGIQGRALSAAASMRYITIKFDDRMSKLYGMENLNTTHPIVVVEGGFDSMFLPNAIAVCGGDVSMSLVDLQKHNVTVALDNECRSKDTVQRMGKSIDMGFNVCFWRIDPDYKDINDMILKGGYSKEQIYEHIMCNSYRGAKAKVALAMWKKI
jgi:hypothetical protein